MLVRLGFLFDRLNIGSLCAAYFILAPVFLPRASTVATIVVFGIGYIFSGLIVALAISERLSVFSETVRFKPLTLFFIAVVVISMASVLFNTPAKLVSPHAYYLKYLKLILPVICMIIMINIWGLSDISRLYKLMAVTALISFGLLLPDFLLWLQRPRGLPRLGMILFDDPNKYAYFLNICFGFAFPKLLYAILNKRTFHLLLAVNVFLLGVLLLTLSRSGIVGCVVVVTLSLYFARSRKLVYGAVAAMIPVFLLFAVAIFLRYTQSEGAVGSDLGRFWSYMVALNIISHRPLLGVGFGNILDAYETFGSIYAILLSGAMSVHNAMLEVFAEQGFFGFLAYVLMSFTPIVLLLRRIRRVSSERYPVLELAAVSIPVVFFVFGLFYPHYLADDIFWIYMTIPLIVLRSEVSSDFAHRFAVGAPISAGNSEPAVITGSRQVGN